MTTIIEILKSISDSKALVIFNTIAHSSTSTSDILITKLKITRKQYYSRLSALTKAGLLQRKNGRYSLTSLGKVIHNTQLSLEKAVNNYWNLKAIDSILMSDNFEIERQEIVKIVDTLVQDPKIKEIVLAQVIPSNPVDNNKYMDNKPLIIERATKSFRHY
jgi:predicted transcriptional regulator